MASGSLGPCCATGFKHEGTPDGEIKLIGDSKYPRYNRVDRILVPIYSVVPTYFAYPKNNKSSKKAIIFMSDAFGQGLVNNKLLADDFARNGYLTVFPDIFAGDPLRVEDFEAGKVDFVPWLARHGEKAVEAILDSTIKHVRDDLGVKKIGAVGYCFGGKVRRYFAFQPLQSRGSLTVACALNSTLFAI